MSREEGRVQGGKNGKRGDAPVTSIGKKLIMNVIDSSEKDIKETLKNIRKKDEIKYMELVVKLMNFVIPKPRTVEMTVDNSNELTDEQLRYIAHCRNKEADKLKAEFAYYDSLK